MVSQRVDVLVLGATGYTGKLIVQYLESHPQRGQFSLGIAGRSLQKLQILSKELSLSSDVSIFAFDITSYAEVEGVVQTASVVINCIGPFFKWSTPIVRACAHNGVHYVDINGEPLWMKDIIQGYDFEASNTKAIIIPASGTDSVPSDLAVYLSARELAKKRPNASIGQSLTAVKMPDSGLSGGTLHTIITSIEEVPRHKWSDSMIPHMLSPVHNAVEVPFRMVWNLPHTNIYGGISPMGSVNEKVVYRTWGLLEARALSTAHRDRKSIRYGPKFQYDECAEAYSRITGLLWSVTFMTSLVAIALLPPVRWFLKMFGPQTGSGPKHYDGAIMTYTNVTSTDAPNPDHVQTTVTFKGGPYSMTAVFAGESALALLFDHDKLTNLAKEGGVLTPMSALGDTLVERLLKSGRVSYVTKPLYPTDTRKAA